MKHALTSITGLIALALGLIASTALAQTTANGPYYAIPSWDQQLPTSTRFIVLSNWSNQAVLDRETGLVWEKSPDATQQDWESAQRGCIRKNVGGRKGWKLPSIQELASLIDPTMFGPSLPAGHPFTNVQTFGYWSASSNASFTSPPNAWVMNFSVGDVLSAQKTLALFFVWCVRGGPGGDAQ